MNRYEININSVNSASTATTINIPINLEFQLVDQAELIEDKFVNIEIEKAINPILDYEKARFVPINSFNNIIDKIQYNVTFTGLSNTYSSIGFTDDDIKFRKNSFKLSFLKLNFYDTDKATDQRLISFVTLYPKITDSNLQPLNIAPPLIPSTVKPANQIPISFELENPLFNQKGIFEGFYLYNYKDEVTQTIPKELFMRATFNNAKNGKSTNLITSSSAYTIDNLVNKLYTKYILTRNNTGFFYQIDQTYSNNVIISGNNITINLYQIQTL